jgi:hypothetical protein
MNEGAVVVMAAAVMLVVVGYESSTVRTSRRKGHLLEHGKLFGQTTTRTTTVCLLLLDTGKVSSPRGLNLPIMIHCCILYPGLPSSCLI